LGRDLRWRQAGEKPYLQDTRLGVNWEQKTVNR
jgi:hypothetical protein